METVEIGYGGDGCVYKPGFCKTSKRNYVSKVMYKERNIAKELEKYAELNLSSLDPKMEYFIYDPELCELSDEDMRKLKRAITNPECKYINPRYALNYVDGGQDLHVILSDIDLPLTAWNDYLYAFKNIFDGIKLLHENGIYHMDIKPDNIVFDKETAQFKLIDFGLSRTLANPPKKPVGSFNYIPPEMEDMPIGEKYKNSDCFALGVTLLDIYNVILRGSYQDEELEKYREIEELALRMTEQNVKYRLTDIDEALAEYINILLILDMSPEEYRENKVNKEKPSSNKKRLSIGGKKHTRSKHKRSKHKRSKHKRSKHKRSKHKRSTTHKKRIKSGL